jgi:hypothetical protein
MLMNAEQERRERYKTFAKWTKEIALLFLAALVVQNILAGASLSDTSVVVGIAIAFIAYAGAIYLMYKK